MQRSDQSFKKFSIVKWGFVTSYLSVYRVIVIHTVWLSTKKKYSNQWGRDQRNRHIPKRHQLWDGGTNSNLGVIGDNLLVVPFQVWFFFLKSGKTGWGCSTVIECLPTKCEALRSVHQSPDSPPHEKTSICPIYRKYLGIPICN
jgi:hypothetical protein